MIYSITGTITRRGAGFLVIENNGVGYKVHVSGVTASNVSPETTLFCYTHVREDALDLYGFLDEGALELYEKLLSISGVGPKSGLAIMDVDSLDNIIASINEGRVDLLSRASGIGKKTAERIILELKGKLTAEDMSDAIMQMDEDQELLEALVGLGYTARDAKTLIEGLDPSITGFKDRLREALKKKEV